MTNRLPVLLLILFLSGCSFFQIRKPIIEQGNIITSKEVNKLHTGMTPEEVTNLMGTPVVTNLFSPDRLDYVYTYKKRSWDKQVKQIDCIFRHGRLVTIRDVSHAAGAPSAAGSVGADKFPRDHLH